MSFGNWGKFAGGKSNAVSVLRRRQSAPKAKSSSRANSAGAAKVERRGDKSKGGGSKKHSRAKKAASPTVAPEWERKYRAESDMRTLATAKEILESPARVKAAKRVAQEQIDAAKEAASAVMSAQPIRG